MLKRVFIFFPIIAVLLGMKHPMHVSVTNIEYKQNNKFIEISSKMFLNDFISILEQTNNIKIDLSSSSAHIEKTNQIMINNYFSTHFSVEINNHKIKFTNFEFVEKKINEESIWLYFKIPNNKKIKNIKIVNTILTDLFSDQNNLLIISIDQEQKGFNLNSKENTAVMQL